jgi:hypothetical protein
VLWQAVKLYKKSDFQHLDQPKGHTGHSEACEIWMFKKLQMSNIKLFAIMDLFMFI